MRKNYRDQILATYNHWLVKKKISAMGCYVPEVGRRDYKSKYKRVWLLGGTTSTYLHRVAWMATHKKRIPKGYVVRHVCNKEWCFNPAHLVIGTKAENEQDKKRFNRRATIDISNFPDL